MIRAPTDETAGRLGVVLRVLAALLLPYALVLSHRNFPTILVLLGLSALPALVRFRPTRWVWFVYGFLFYALLSVLWSPYEDRMTWPLPLMLLAILPTALMLSGGVRTSRWFVYAVMTTVVLLGFEAVTGGVIRDFLPPVNRPDKDDVASARGILGVISLAPAAVLFAWQRGGVKTAAVLLVPLVWAAASFGIAANLLAVVFGGGVAAFAYFWPKMTIQTLFFGLAAGFVAMPAFAAMLPSTDVMMTWDVGPASWRMRLMIWKDVWSAVEVSGIHTVFGHGIESVRVLGEQLGDRLVIGADVASKAVPTHPHNVFLQVWYDLGLIGACLSVAAIGFGAKSLFAAHLERPMAMAVAALVGGTAVFATVDASLWTMWRLIGPIIGAWMLIGAAKLLQRNISFG